MPQQPVTTPEQGKEQESKPQPGLAERVVAHSGPAAFASGSTHYIRVVMTRSYWHPGLFDAVNDLPAHGNKAFLTNVARGTTIISAQSGGKKLAEYYLGPLDTGQKQILGLLCTSTCGSGAACFVETPFNRKTSEHYKNHVTWVSISKAGFTRVAGTHPAFRFTPFIWLSFMNRDLGFSSLVHFNKDLSPTAFAFWLSASSAWTATWQNLAIRAGTEDLLSEKDGSFPRFSVKTFKPTLGKMARGEYTHPNYSVSYPNPKTSFHLLFNVLSLCCGKNMFFWRTVYIASFRTALSVASDPKAAWTKFHLWSQNLNRPAEGAKHDELPVLKFTP